ncbi:MAG: ATP-binding cassette domain-containing protein [Eubacteriales bacterium]|nr:ATP-binding cassette domain-containing protein [Eubacteriales bacterium]
MQLSFKQVNKSFGDNHVLKDLSFHAESGKAFGLLGRNGAGKTTSIRILMNVFAPDSGDVVVDGKSILNKKEDVRSFGYLPEEKGLYPKYQILHQMIYIGSLRGLSRREAKANARYWLDRLDMLQYQNRKLETLSKGNQQKIQLAVCLITNPELVILDEPFSGLDPVNSQLLRDVVKDLVDAGKLVLFSSHQMTYVESFCDQIAILDQGEIVLSGSIKEVKRSYPRDTLSIRLGTAQASLPPEETKALVEQLQASNALSCPVHNIRCTLDGILLELEGAEQKDQLLRDLVQLDTPIERFEVVEPSLEDIFVRTTSRAEVKSPIEEEEHV